MCMIACVCVCRESNSKREISVCMLIYDAVLVINMSLSSHLDALIDTCNGEHMGWELEM